MRNFRNLEKFLANFKTCYVPSFDLTIDKQLFPSKTRCPFIQYTPNKPDKFGTKFWLLADVCSKYFCNVKPYLGKDPTKNGQNDLPTDVCLWLMQTFLEKEHNMAMDNYFTGTNLSYKVKAEKTTLLGPIRKQSKEVSKFEKMMKGKPLYLSEIYQSFSNATLTIYKAKKGKLMCMLSSIPKQFLLIHYILKNHQKKSRVTTRQK